MSHNFYNKHKKLLSVLMVAVFVAGGVLTEVRKVEAAEPSFWHSFSSLIGVGWRFSKTGLAGVFYNRLSGQQDKPDVIDVGSATYNYYTGSSEPTNFIDVYEQNISGDASVEIGELGRVVADPNSTPAEKQAAVAQVAAIEQKAAERVADAENQKPSSFERVLGSMISWFLYYIAVGLGWIMMLIAKVMLVIAIFNNFLKQPAVQVGWTITRDICNNFFIVFMMILAAGVTLHLPNYTWRTMLPKILIFAVVINFSMTITGVLIDISQVLMLTFASPLVNTKGYEIIISAFGLPDALSMERVLAQWSGANAKSDGTLNTQGINFIDIIAALLFAIIVTVVAIIVITCITCILVYRIIMLMFLVILSPLFFLSKASNINAFNSMATEWMGMLSKMLTVGPAMMFFLYLSFMTMAAVNNLNPSDPSQGGPILSDSNVGPAIAADTTSPISGGTSGGPAQAGKPLSSEQDYTALSNMASLSGLFNFLVVCGLLYASLMMGKKFGDAAGNIAGKGMGQIMSGAKKFSGFNLAAKKAAQLQKAPGAIVKMGLAKAGTGALGLTSAATTALGKKWKSEGLQKLGETGSQWRQDVLGSRRKARAEKFAKFAKDMGLGDKSVAKLKEFTDTDFAKNTKAIALGAGSVLATGGMALATGGAGLIPGLATAAAGYLGGGGRLLELMLGQRGGKREDARKAEEQKIKEEKENTNQVEKDSAQARDKEVEKKLNQKTERLKFAESFKDSATTARNEELARAKESFESGPNKGVQSFYDAWTDRIQKDYEKQIKISDTKKAQAEADFGSDDKIREEAEQEHHDRVIEKLRSTGHEDEANRFATTYEADASHKIETAAIEETLAKEIEKIKLKPISEMDKIVETRAAQSKHDAALALAETKRAEKIAAVEPKVSARGGIDTFLDDYKPYAHENWVSQAAGKDASKMQQAVKNLVEAMEDSTNQLKEMSGGSFYSSNGQTETQYKSIKAMTESTAAIKNLISELSAMDNEVNGAEAKMVKELKQGIAAYGKGGGDTSMLAGVIALLNQKKGVNKDGQVTDDKTVSEYEAKIKPKA